MGPLSRRQLLGSAAAGLAALGLPGRALAQQAADRRFVFVVNYGGWDPTRVFATELDNRAVDTERAAELGDVRGLTFVDHPDRPSVRAFFERYASRALVLNGVLVPSVAHENCLRLCMTGTTADGAPDWPAVMAHRELSAFALPHVVVSGPSFPGPLGAAVTRAGSSGQLEAMLNGAILDWSETPVGGPSLRAEDVMDRYMARRLAAAAQAPAPAREQALLEAYRTSLDRALTLKDLQDIVDWSAGADLQAQSKLAVSALSLGISRCATLSWSGRGWDTHTNNDGTQSYNFEGLFSGLVDLVDRLETTSGPDGAPLAEDTVVVVLSEMGRTPRLNAGQGKDHWPYTSMMVMGPGVTGGRSVGGFDAWYYGELVDFATGDITRGGRELTSASVGATLLQLAGIDHREFHPGVDPVPGLLSG